MRIQLRFLSVASLEFQVNLNAQYRTLKHEGYRYVMQFGQLNYERGVDASCLGAF